MSAVRQLHQSIVARDHSRRSFSISLTTLSREPTSRHVAPSAGRGVRFASSKPENSNDHPVAVKPGEKASTSNPAINDTTDSPKYSDSSTQGNKISDNDLSATIQRQSSINDPVDSVDTNQLRVKTINPFDGTYRQWEDANPYAIHDFQDLPHQLFGYNQHMIMNAELKELLRTIIREFKAPIMYCFAYGSGVFPQTSRSHSVNEAEFRAVHPAAPAALVKAQKGGPKIIDFIFGVTHTQHWHSVNMRFNPHHYSFLAGLGSATVSHVQERLGAGVYFHPYVQVNGMLVKYGITSIDNLVHDLSTWDTLYLAGRLQKPVKILRDHPRVRLANQHNLIAAFRTALLLLPEEFTERELYATITSFSYLGDPRMALPTESSTKIADIVSNNMVHFRRLYAPLAKTMPNVSFVADHKITDLEWVLDASKDHNLRQSMDIIKRGNMVRRLPAAFRSRLYYRYQKKFSIPHEEFKSMMEESADETAQGAVKKRDGTVFDRRIATDEPAQLHAMVRTAIRQTVSWPATTQSLKGPLTAGWARSIRYLSDKIKKCLAGWRNQHDQS